MNENLLTRYFELDEPFKVSMYLLEDSCKKKILKSLREIIAYLSAYVHINTLGDR